MSLTKTKRKELTPAQREATLEYIRRWLARHAERMKNAESTGDSYSRESAITMRTGRVRNRRPVGG